MMQFTLSSTELSNQNTFYVYYSSLLNFERKGHAVGNFVMVDWGCLFTFCADKHGHVLFPLTLDWPGVAVPEPPQSLRH